MAKALRSVQGRSREEIDQIDQEIEYLESEIDPNANTTIH